jgi:hypothetical protein
MNSSELNSKIHKMIQISSQENMLLKFIENFYVNLKNTYDFLSIINSESKISIRLIDYFVTKYSKKNKVYYKLNENNNQTLFYVFQSYKQQLKAFQKKNFDPFARGIRIPYFLQNVALITTIGQLNFFKWFISKDILNYVKNNKNIIEYDMNKNKKNKVEPKIKKSLKSYKKNEMKINIINPIKPIPKVSNHILVTF